MIDLRRAKLFLALLNFIIFLIHCHLLYKFFANICYFIIVFIFSNLFPIVRQFLRFWITFRNLFNFWLSLNCCLLSSWRCWGWHFFSTVSSTLSSLSDWFWLCINFFNLTDFTRILNILNWTGWDYLLFLNIWFFFNNILWLCLNLGDRTSLRLRILVDLAFLLVNIEVKFDPKLTVVGFSHKIHCLHFILSVCSWGDWFVGLIMVVKIWVFWARWERRGINWFDKHIQLFQCWLLVR